MLFANIRTVAGFEGSGSTPEYELEWFEKELLNEMVKASNKKVTEMTADEMLEIFVGYEERKVEMGITQGPNKPSKSPRIMMSHTNGNNAKSGVIMNFNGSGPITNHIYFIEVIQSHPVELQKQMEYIFGGFQDSEQLAS